MKALMTGGSGLLGKELRKYIKCVHPNSKSMDITLPQTLLGGEFDTIIHCAAYTDVPKAEIEKKECFSVNVIGTLNLLEAYPKAKFVYISSEYANNPLNFYSWTKFWGEQLVAKREKWLIIRTSFNKNPFVHDFAFFDQYTQGDYVEKIAPMIAAEIVKDSRGLVYVGTGRKTIFELARQTQPNIKGISVDDIKSVKLPKDYKSA